MITSTVGDTSGAKTCMVVMTRSPDEMRYVIQRLEIKDELDQRFQMGSECGSARQIKVEGGRGI